MRLVRLGVAGWERPAVMASDDAPDAFHLADMVSDSDAEFFAADGLERVAAAVASGRLPRISVENERIGPPIARAHAIYGIGLNYLDHAREVGAAAPAERIAFNKSPDSLVGSEDDILLPPGSTHTDWEAELGVVVRGGPRCLSSPDEAATHIAGYVAVNDVSERDMKLDRGGQRVNGKSFETVDPSGPALVTPDEVPNASHLRLVPAGRWRDRAGREHGGHDLRSELPHLVLEPVPRPRTRGPHQHRHSCRRGDERRPAAIPPAAGRGAARHLRPWPPRDVVRDPSAHRSVGSPTSERKIAARGSLLSPTALY